MQALVSRRRALKGAACTAALGAVPFSTLRTAVAKAMNDQETVTWSACTVNCGSRCPVRVVTRFLIALILLGFGRDTSHPASFPIPCFNSVKSSSV